MSDITLRNVKGTPLTNQEVDDNFSNLNTDKYQAGDSPTFADITTDSLQASVVYASNSNSDNWTTAYGWGNHATAGYQPANTALTTSTNFNGDVTGVYNNLVITGYNNTNWDTAYGWGDHGGLYEIKTKQTSANINNSGTDMTGLDDGWYKWGSTKPTDAPFNYASMLQLSDTNQKIQMAFGSSSRGRLAIRRADSGTFYNWTSVWTDADFSSTKIGNWDTAYGWGNHATAGYLTSASLTGYATETYVNTAVSNLVDSAPATLDTLNELAAALGDDPNFATTVTNSIATKLPLSGGTLTGALTIQLNAESSRAPTALTLHSTMGDINGAGDTDGTFIEFKATDGNATFTPQVKIGMLVKDYTGDGGIPSEGTGNFVVYTAQGTDSGGSGTLTERFRVREDGPLYAGSDRVFADNYHPNADKWTTARTNTVTLTGAVTGSGSASVDGSGNWTVTVPTTTNHTHNYDNYGSWTAKDHDGTTYTVTSGDTLWFKEGGAIDVNFTADDELTISHADTSSQGSVNNSNGTVIQDVTLDGFGHVTGLASVDLDGRYVREGGTAFSGTYPMVSRIGARNIYSNGNITFNGTTNGLTVSGRVDAPVFYDSNDTGFFLDPNASGDPATTSLKIRGGIRWHTDELDFSVGVHSGMQPMSMRIWDNYTQTGAPQTYGTVLDIYGRSGHWRHQFHYLGSNLQFRSGGYGSETWSGWQSIFHDGYHPNADTWTTARTNTVTLTGDVTGTGSASVNGSGNWTVSISTAVANNSHTHDTIDVQDVRNTTPLPSGLANKQVQSFFNNQTIPSGLSSWYSTLTVKGWDGSYAAWELAGNATNSAQDGLFFRYGKGATWNSWQRVFTDNYHPNADTWTTARTNTVTLTGDVTGTGSASVNGSGNWTVSIAADWRGGTANTSVNMNNFNIENVNNLTFNDPGPGEGIEWKSGNGWKIYESPDDLATNSGGNLQFVTSSTRRATLDTSGSLWTSSQGTLWGSSNDGSGSGLDADLLDGQHGSYYNHRNYTDATTYLGGYYVSGGSEKPNNTIFGAGKLKVAMLSGSNLGFGGSWNDVLWMSTYNGSDVKGSWAIVGDKYSDNVYIARQNYDSASWGTGHKLWHSGNDGSGSGLDADLLDGQHGSYYAPASHGHSYLPLTGGTLDGGADTTLTLLSNDAGRSRIALHGDNQGSGQVFVGQSASYGGGIEYNGDNSPGYSGAGSDNTALFRTSGGTTTWTAKNHVNSNDWYFRASLYASENQRVFADNYHPNADKWTTARTNTVTLTGDVTGTGSASVDGSGNWTVSLSTVVGDDSHSHSNYVEQLADTTSPNYQASSSRRVDPNASNPTNEHYAVITFGNEGNVTGQLATHFVSGQPYTRGYNSGWSAWRKIWTDSNDGSGSGLDADLLDGQHGSYYAPASSLGGYVAKTGDTMTGTLTYTKLNGPSTSNRDKIRLYSSSSYVIGMQSGITYGGLNDWAMTFQFNNDSERGFWWGHEGHTTAQGAMSLTTAGHLYVGSRVDAPIFYDSNNTAYYTNPASTSVLSKLNVNNGLKVGEDIYIPDENAQWAAAGNTTGCVVIELPQTTSNYDMPIFTIETYEYGGQAHTTYTVSGHNWTTPAWYNNSVTAVGLSPDSVRLGVSPNGRHCIIIGTESKVWHYGHVHVTKVTAAPFYSSQDWLSNFNTFVTTSLTGYTNVTSDLVCKALVEFDSQTGGFAVGNTMWLATNTSEYNDYNENIRLYPSGNGVSVIAFGATGAGGEPWQSVLGYSDRLETRYRGTWEQRQYSGYVEARGSYRAPIFYDSNDTSYYLDAAGNSIFHEIRIDDLLRHNGDTNTYFQFHAADQARIVTGGSERFEVNNTYVKANNQFRTPFIYDLNDTAYYVDPNGTSKLNVVQLASATAELEVYDGATINVYSGTNYAYENYIYGDTSTNYMVIQSVLGNGLHVKNSVNSNGVWIRSNGTVEATGDITAYSDERLKENIKTLDGSKVLQMRGVSFTKDGKEGSGVIAQELEKVAPELVNNEGEFKSVAYGNIVGYLIEAIKEQQSQIEALQIEIKSLKEK